MTVCGMKNEHGKSSSNDENGDSSSDSSSSSSSDDEEPVRRIRINIRPQAVNSNGSVGANNQDLKACVESWRPLGPFQHSLSRRQSSLSSISFGGKLQSSPSCSSLVNDFGNNQQFMASNTNIDRVFVGSSSGRLSMAAPPPPSTTNHPNSMTGGRQRMSFTGSMQNSTQFTPLFPPTSSRTSSPITDTVPIAVAIQESISLNIEGTTRKISLESSQNSRRSSCQIETSSLNTKSIASSSVSSISSSTLSNKSLSSAANSNGDLHDGDANFEPKFQTRLMGNVKLAFSNSLAKGIQARPTKPLRFCLSPTENIVKFYASRLIKDLNPSTLNLQNSSTSTLQLQQASRQNNFGESNFADFENFNNIDRANNPSHKIGNFSNSDVKNAQQNEFKQQQQNCDNLWPTTTTLSNNHNNNNQIQFATPAFGDGVFDPFSLQNNNSVADIFQDKNKTKEGKIFELDTDILMAMLKRMSDQQPQLRYYNIDVLRYQITPMTQLHQAPLQVCAYWNVNPETKIVKLRIDFQLNPQSSGIEIDRIRDISFTINLNHHQTFNAASTYSTSDNGSLTTNNFSPNVLSRPKAHWNNSIKQLKWKFDVLDECILNGEQFQGDTTASTISDTESIRSSAQSQGGSQCSQGSLYAKIDFSNLSNASKSSPNGFGSSSASEQDPFVVDTPLTVGNTCASITKTTDPILPVPSPVDVKFFIVDSTLSKVKFSLVSSNYKMTLLKKEVRSSGYCCQPFIML